jgi:hypothetical protein
MEEIVRRDGADSTGSGGSGCVTEGARGTPTRVFLEKRPQATENKGTARKMKDKEAASA